MAKQPAKYDPGLTGMEIETETVAVERWLWKMDMQRSRKEGGQRGKHKIRRVKGREGASKK